MNAPSPNLKSVPLLSTVSGILRNQKPGKFLLKLFNITSREVKNYILKKMDFFELQKSVLSIKVLINEIIWD